MAGSNEKREKQSPDQIVRKVIELILASSSQELFFAIKQDPGAVHKLTIQEIGKIIVDVLSKKDNQYRFKKGLDALSALENNVSVLKTIANDIGQYYNEYSSDNPSVFRNYPERNTAEYHITESGDRAEYKFCLDSEDPTVENPCPWRISELTRKLSSMDVSEIINTTFQRLFVDMFTYNSEGDTLVEKYTPEELDLLKQKFSPDHIQYRIYDDFSKLHVWQKKLLGQYALKQPKTEYNEREYKGYAERSTELSAKLKAVDINDFTILHRDTLSKLIKSYQSKEAPENNLFYLTGIKNGSIYYSTEAFGSLENLYKEISADPDDEIKKLKENIQTYIEHKIYADNLGPSTVRPDHQNKPATYIEPATYIKGGSKYFALPIGIKGSDETIKGDIYNKLFSDTYPKASLPIRFDVGFLIRGSHLSIDEGALTIRQGRSDDDWIYPVIVCDGVAVIVHDFSALKGFSGNSSIIRTRSIQDNPIAEEMATMLHRMLIDTDNTYDEHTEKYENAEDKKNLYNPLIYGAKSSKRTEFRNLFPDTPIQP